MAAREPSSAREPRPRSNAASPATRLEIHMLMQQSRFHSLAAAAFVSAALLMAPRPAAAQSATLDDPTIIAIFDAANTWDMETGALAASKGTSKEVRDFGAMLVRDHRTVRQ